MALQKQNYIVPLGVGLDQKKDDKQLDVGKLLLLENAVFTKINKLTKRFGYDLLANVTLTGTVLDTNSALLLNDTELLRVSSGKMYSYMQSGLWIDKGYISQVSVKTTSMARGNTNLTQTTSVSLSGATAYAWYDGTTVRTSVTDQTSGQVVLANYQIATGAAKPYLIASNNYIYLYYCRTNNLCVRRLSPLTPQTFDTEIILTNTIHADNYFDLVVYGANILTLVYKNTSSYIVTAFCKITGDIGTALDGLPSPVTYTGETINNAVAVQILNAGDLTNDAVYAFYHSNTTGLKCLIYNTALSNTPSPVVIDSTTTLVRNICSAFISNSQLKVFYELYNANIYNRLIYSNTLTHAGVAGTPAVLLRSVGLCSKPLTVSGTTYLIIGHDGNSGYLQATYFMIDTTGRIINKFNADNGGSANNPISQTTLISPIGNNKYVFSALIKTQLVAENGSLFGILGVSSHVFDFATTDLFDYERLGQDLHIAGGLLYFYDGINIVEQGFNLFPDNITQLVVNGVGYLIAGVRSAVFIYEWTDNKGQIHKSAPSVPLQYTTATPNSYCTFTISTLRLTERKGTKGEVRIVGYSTVNNGTTYYRMTSVTSPLLNDTTADSVSFVWGDDATETDALIIYNEILYTTGGVLEDIQPPSCTIIESYNNRLFIAGLEDEAEIWYSKEYVKGEAIAFNDGLVLRADKDVGPVTGLATMDDKLLIFKATSIYAVAGQGPTDTGANNDLQVPQMITIDTGCTENKSLVRTPLGIIFKSAKGLYLLSRDLTCSYIGAEVEDYNSYTVVDSELMTDTTQIRFALNSGTILMYDYYYQQWGVFTKFTDIVSAVSWDGKFTFAKSTGDIYTENTNYLDAGQFYSMKLATPWIKVNGIQGYQRIYSGLVLGSYKSDHVLKIRVAYDYEDFYRETLYLDTKNIINLVPYGGKTPYGNGGYSGDDTVYQFQFKQSTQKCNAIKFEISDIDKYITGQDSFDISSMILEVGTKSGYNRISVDKTFTS